MREREPGRQRKGTNNSVMFRRKKDNVSLEKWRKLSKPPILPAKASRGKTNQSLFAIKHLFYKGAGVVLLKKQKLEEEGIPINTRKDKILGTAEI